MGFIETALCVVALLSGGVQLMGANASITQLICGWISIGLGFLLFIHLLLSKIQKTKEEVIAQNVDTLRNHVEEQLSELRGPDTDKSTESWKTFQPIVRMVNQMGLELAKLYPSTEENKKKWWNFLK